MIATWRGVIALAVVALALALAVALDTPRAPGSIDRAIVPGFGGIAARLAWHRPPAPDVVVVRQPDGTWRLQQPPAELDNRAVETVLATLRGARWHRRGARARAGTIHATLDVDRHVIELGDAIAGTDQGWLVVDSTALLVDGWVRRALDPDPLALRERHPFAEAATGARSRSRARVSRSSWRRSPVPRGTPAG